jgi:flagellar protein FlgJ
MNLKQKLWCIKILRDSYKSKIITKLPASAVAAQARLESGFGQSEPIDWRTGKRSYNLFGVKAYPEKGYVGTNGYVACYTHEEIDGEMELKLLHFRAYYSYEESFNDHARILSISKDDNGEQRYREAFDYLDDSEQFIIEVYRAGYATDSKYLENIIPIIRQFNRIPIWVLKL